MSDLYHETSESGTAEPGTGWQPAYDAASYQHDDAAEPEPGHGYESPADADRYGEYHETEADTEARIADQDDLPTPAESRATTWGDNPEYYDEADLAYEYDGDLSALPTEEDSPATWHTSVSPETEDTHAEAAIAPEDTPDSYAQGANADSRAQDAASTANDQLDQAGTDLAATGPGLASEVQDTQAADDSAPAAGRPDDPPTGALDSSAAGPAEQAEHSPVGTSERITELEAENAQLGKSITDLQARLERLEQANQEQPVAPILDRTGERSYLQ